MQNCFANSSDSYDGIDRVSKRRLFYFGLLRTNSARSRSAPQSIAAVSSEKNICQYGRERNHRVPTDNSTKGNQKISVPKNSTNPNIFLANARSVINKIDDLRVRINLYSCDFIIITKTWLHSFIENKLTDLPNYCNFRDDQLIKKGGDVCIWALSHII